VQIKNRDYFPARGDMIDEMVIRKRAASKQKEGSKLPEKRPHSNNKLVVQEKECFTNSKMDFIRCV
jgi:hypothetical protein